MMRDDEFSGPPAARLRLNGLTTWLYGLDEDRVVVSFDELERVTGCRLNQSLRRYQQSWSPSAHYARYWKGTGYRPSFRGVPTGHIAFIREG